MPKSNIIEKGFWKHKAELEYGKYTLVVFFLSKVSLKELISNESTLTYSPEDPNNQ